MLACDDFEQVLQRKIDPKLEIQLRQSLTSSRSYSLTMIQDYEAIVFAVNAFDLEIEVCLLIYFIMQPCIHILFML